ncbi:DUF1203 domain-containing protein [Sphingopyxis flava]|uniref:DUF1203 domain-containing protein n=1 Tax=Sphingopyxis flava TaxID=1507287 RepID=A0A1T5BZM6_9SPHN|nr:DUF1203 domain-containing protein [Sphingopyxis flava]SKB52617.1 Protein of unknown function [Sphingopyxis flava]
MTYIITGLAPEPFAPLFTMNDADLAARGARRIIAQSDRAYPCRVSLEDARAGETLLLLHHVHHDVATPYRSAFAIYVRQGVAATRWRDAPPPVFEARMLSLRAFDREGMLRTARLAQPGDGDGAIRALFADPATAYIDAHNAAYGCFAARIERDEP